MTQLFITSDEHIGHARIIELANRPFTSLDEMKHTVITNHNKKVPNSRGVLTVHVGDWLWHNLTLDEVMDYINQLNGRHAFMFGNHDETIEKHRHYLSTQLDFIWGENKAGGRRFSIATRCTSRRTTSLVACGREATRVTAISTDTATRLSPASVAALTSALTETISLRGRLKRLSRSCGPFRRITRLTTRARA